uniref:Amino acid adenylation domain-containing protein/thioester reductase domain-containing protein n=1 Tax=Candidatus Kentrum sp. MB TaxID=2138164 RepID=A0A451B7K0_9GAMM|nr:MAG: amino acid adenylation domain-containing protein/thioester reductase domain-containing protein [Candidatus Kentron sp. MB]VFK28327.1 MAG: amino acid adenylation domain-containing protein/thioester reductase domain-containing protein [Candidatus Kentron sp. MB]VFK74207.1 MAG: amino acid adenylation domain-containing protein/thioester reductase domain-containing protein [Candidatus Kentron sp. MB]
MNNLPEMMKENLSPEEKRILLKKLFQDKATRLKTSHPLSYGQKALWFLHRSAPHSSAYNTASVVRIHSPLDVPALRDTFQTLVMRHSSLRSTFSQQDGQPVQVIHGHREVCFEEIDASTDTEEAFHERVAEAYRRPFDLEQGPLLRVSLFRHAAEDHVLLMTLHHTVTDGWSIWMLMSELLSLYPAQKSGQPVTLPPVPWQYQDFVKWQDELIASSEGRRQWEYWKNQLSGELPILELPTDRPRPPAPSYEGGSVFFTLPPTLIEKLEEQAQRSNATLYMILLAAFQVFLHRYTGQDDILVASPTAGRNRSEFEGICGYFVNPIVLRAALQDDPTFTSFLDQVRKTVVGGLANQDFPFPLLVERLQPHRDTSHSPIFQSIFVLQRPDDKLIALLGTGDESFSVHKAGLSLSPFKMPQQEGQLDLTLEVFVAEHSSSAFFFYNTDLFEKRTIERMVGHFRQLLEGIVAAPETRVSHLPLMSKIERQRILLDWNNTRTPYPQDKCVHELFEEKARDNPGAVALVCEDKEITYEELNTRANRLAHRLRTLGVGPEVTVGLFIERSVELIVGILATLKASGAYVPLDLKYPKERLTFMIEDAGLAVLLCHGATRENLPECSARVLDSDANAAEIAGESPDNPAPPPLVNPGNLAYVMYTSGSTGTPKGVCVEHGNIVRLVRDTNYMDFDETQVFLQSSQVAFDASTFEIWGSLLNGAKLVLPSPGHLSMEQLGGYLRKYDVTALFLTTALFNLIVQERPDDITGLRFLLCGGEVGSPDNIKEGARLLAPGKLLHCYGPTENTTFSTYYIVPIDVDTDHSIPIGAPITNTQIYILDHRMQPVPAGINGELYTGGVGVARGYLNHPELTAEKFIPDPFSQEPDARLYRTGDLCRWLPDDHGASGNIEFLGRIDNQVKIRGFRIECGEVENALSAYPGIREVVVDPRGEGANKHLIAWLTAETEDTSALRDTLRTHLRDTLPDWMAPSRFIFLESFPLTPSGKIDRRALSLPKDADTGSVAEYVAPQTEAEIQMATFWSQTLGVDKIGLHDDFFELGGHSILAIQLISRIKEHFGVDVPIRALFEDPTVAGLLRELGLAETNIQTETGPNPDLPGQTVQSQSQSQSTSEIKKPSIDPDIEAQLEDDIRPPAETLSAAQVEHPEHVLVTGARGLLGVHLVGELLRRTRATIWCFVRGKDQQDAEKRLKAALVEYDQAIDGWQQRIRIVTGDLKQKRLGLSEQVFHELSEKIHVIYHNGAEVNHMYPYRELRKANVNGVKEILRLACAKRKKPVHYVSTISVFAGTEQPIREDSRLISHGLIENGYVQSKWVGEKLVWEAGNRGLPVAVYRPDRIGGHSKTGKWNDKDTFYQMLMAGIGLGVSPDWEYAENVAPVDYCAEALVWLSLREQTFGKAYHLANTHSLSSRELTDHLRANGFNIRLLPYKEWRKKIDRHTDDSDDEGVLEHLLDHTIGEDGSFLEGEAQEIECAQTVQALQGSGIQCPPITAELIGRYVNAMRIPHKPTVSATFVSAKIAMTKVKMAMKKRFPSKKRD